MTILPNFGPSLYMDNSHDHDLSIESLRMTKRNCDYDNTVPRKEDSPSPRKRRKNYDEINHETTIDSSLSSSSTTSTLSTQHQFRTDEGTGRNNSNDDNNMLQVRMMKHQALLLSSFQLQPLPIRPKLPNQIVNIEKKKNEIDSFHSCPKQ
jgi:hypothetical protein